MAKIKINLDTAVSLGGVNYLPNDPADPHNQFHEFDEGIGINMIERKLGTEYIEPPKKELEDAGKAEADRKAALLKKDESPLRPKWLEEAKGKLARGLEEVPESAMAIVTEGAETKKALMENVKAYIEAFDDTESGAEGSNEHPMDTPVKARGDGPGHPASSE